MGAYEDFAGKDGSTENIGGTEQKIHYAPISDFETIQSPPDFKSGTEIGSSVAIATDHVMKTGKKLSTIVLNMNSGRFNAEAVGEIGGKGVAPKFEGFLAGNYKHLIELQRNLNSDLFIFFIPLADGMVIQIGDDKQFAEASLSLVGGENGGTTKGGTLMVSSSSKSAWVYEGDLPLTEAV